ncbi:hypothetical protein Tco_1116200, partial [Tanacetum coccineum]
MKRPTKGYSGQEVALFPTMPSRITSSPSHSPEPSFEHSPDHTTAVDDLKKTKLTYSAAVTKLILRVKKLEFKLKAGTVKKRARVVLSEDDEDDSSKQRRKLSDAEVQEKASTETEPIIQEVTCGSCSRSTASEVPVISTGEENISTVGRTVTYRRRSEEERKRKDKGKAIMTEPEPKKKSKKELKQERLSFAEAIRLQEQMDEE